MKRLIILLYGALSYLVFLASFLYAIAFVGNFPGFKSIDSGVAGPTGRALLIDVVLLALFAVQHSVMARQPFKRAWIRIIPEAAERSTYVLLASLLLFLLYWQWQPLPRLVWQVTSVPATLFVDVLFWSGWLIVLISTFLIDHFDLFGLKQVYMQFRQLPCRPPEFKMSGFYHYVRHPIMAGFIIAFWSAPKMSAGHLLFALTTTAYIFVAIVLEERDLTGFYGERYRKYRNQVWALLPLSRITSSLEHQ
jgi:protein-S-isoprenylcysteine O-methyltransferase Ste14